MGPAGVEIDEQRGLGTGPEAIEVDRGLGVGSLEARRLTVVAVERAVEELAFRPFEADTEVGVLGDREPARLAVEHVRRSLRRLQVAELGVEPAPARILLQADGRAAVAAAHEMQAAAAYRPSSRVRPDAPGDPTRRMARAYRSAAGRSRRRSTKVAISARL